MLSGHQNIACPLAAAAHKTPDAVYLATDEHIFRYGEFSQLVSLAAEEWRQRCADSSSVLAVQAGNSWQLVALIWAAIRSGRTICPLSTRLPTAAAQEIAEQELRTNLLTAPQISEWFAAIPSSSASCSTAAAPTTLNPAVPATMICSSGSTGRPKIIAHSLQNHVANAAGANQVIPLGPHDRWLLSLPLYHVGGMGVLFRCALASATVVLPGVVTSLSNLCQAQQITHLSVVSTQLQRMLAESLTLNSLKTVLLGGGPLVPSLVRQAIEVGLPVRTTYGMSEMASQVTTSADWLSRPEHIETALSSGHVLPGRQVHVTPDGEIWVRGESLMLGYYRDGQIEPTVNNDGWFATRDRGYWNEAGELIVQGRIDNMFISGGENIYPEEIEQALLQLPDIQQALVVPVPDNQYGARPVAFVEWATDKRQPGERQWAEQIRQQLQQELPKFKVPDRILAWDSRISQDGPKPSRATARRIAAELDM
ncbi:MAG: o-succinylbenzoate--CoA ligase [Planctomycetales bacterium]|nr:o-succinylbenzoate--CoA ligase [Planctomycetales bacterium]